MTMQWVEFTVMVTPYNAERWRMLAHVCGVWAAHEPHPSRVIANGGFPWQITHLPTGTAALVAPTEQVAIETIERLATLPDDDSGITVTDEGAKIIPPSVEWVRLCANALNDLPIHVTGNGRVFPITRLARNAERMAHRQRTAAGQ